MSATHDKRCLINWIRAETMRLSGRRYQIDLEALDITSLRDLQRLLRDLETEKDYAVRQARLFPWQTR